MPPRRRRATSPRRKPARKPVAREARASLLLAPRQQSRALTKPRLLVERGRSVPEWQRTAANRAILNRLAADAKAAPRFKVPPLDLKPEQLVTLGEIVAIPKISPRELLFPWPYFCRIVCAPPPLPHYRVRKDQSTLTVTEWSNFICAIETLARAGVPAPVYNDYVDLHDQAFQMANMAWGAHGLNFLSWHREYLAKLEARLILINPLVTIPYWNWAVDRTIPPQLSNPQDLAAWGITRNFNASWLPTQAQVDFALASGVTPPSFSTLQSAVQSIHNGPHIAVGGTMATARSPADPLFWLHHGFIDKIWADWQRANPGAQFNPLNAADTLQPPPIITRTISQVLRTTDLGYVYQ